VLLNEINAFEKIAVEFVSGATPTAHLFDEEGNDVDSFVLGDIGLEDVLKLFEKHGFKLERKGQIEANAAPSSVTEIGNVYYELYSPLVSFESAKAFAKAKNRGSSQGRLLTYNCSFQEALIRKWLSIFKVSSIWLGGERVNSKFAWVDGPLQGITFQDNVSQYSNWASGEPNNAGGREDCVVQNLKESTGWNDVNCLLHLAHIVVEYGKTVVPCPTVSEIERTTEAYDPNFPFVAIEEVNL